MFVTIFCSWHVNISIYFFFRFAAILLIIIGYLCLMTLRVLVSIVILGKACDLITQHQNYKHANTSPNATPKK